MSGPKSLQRASSCCCCCCCKNNHRHRSCHHYHYRRHCNRHRRDDYHAKNGDNGDEKILNNISYISVNNNNNNNNNNGAERLNFVDDKREGDFYVHSERRDSEKERIIVKHNEESHEPHLFGKNEKIRRFVEIDDDDDDDENSKRYERLGINNDDENDDVRGKFARDRRNRDCRFSWQIDSRDDLITRQQRRDTCRRNGGQRGIASNIFLLATAGAFLALAIVAPPVLGTSSERDEASRPRMGGTGTGTALAPSPPNVREERVPVVDTRTSSTTGTNSGADITGSIDLLAALQLYNTTRTGVTQVPGLVRLKPAYYLQGEERDLRLNEASFERAAALLRRVPEFTVAAALRQEEANSGTIVAFSHGNNRYLELQSSGRKDELRLHYVSRRDGTVHVEAFPFRLADGAWHRLALSISGSQVELLVDCHPLYRRLLRPGPPDTNFTLPQLQLWVGQRNAKHFLFKGALQDVKLIPGAHGYLSQCPQLDSSCPTCGQFSILQNTVEQLMHNLNELTRRLAAAEGRISKVEECECQKSCRANGTVHEDGATWEKGCEQCSCVHGDIECRPTPCAPVTCKNPVIPQGQCCPVCLKQCYLHGVIYDHGEKVSPKQCVECDCFDGSFTCQRFNTETRCPPLPCPANEQISVAEECCKFCPGVDYCAKGHECHANASCLNLQTTYACHCNIGFQGDGHKCHDVDECKQQGGSDGHHCNANTRCVNVVGSYTCECLPGYHRIDKFNCAELDECATGHHSCSEHATCINTAGSYYCVCNDGYAGDGYTCKPVCEQSCQNGGECVAPGRCSCRRGYIGNSCELDLDECASDLHRCHHSSTCFNMPGWYYCRCKPGYRSALHDSNQGTQCLDIDECNDQTIERRHTCHPSARCVNTEGGYECSCTQENEQQYSSSSGDLRDSSSSSSAPSSSSSSSSSSLSLQDNECRLSCWYEGREVANSETFAPAGNPCRRCTCKDGVITCREPICDCSAPGSRRDKCCPQCDPAASCRHQELHHLVFRSGERWIYQCQTCECLYGEIDCWQMECPPVTCLNPVTEDGDCCPRCEDDPCARELPGLSASSAATNNGTSTIFVSSSGHPQPCSYAGLLHESGSSWQDLHDKCTTCECKDGQLCCSYDYRCAGDLEDKRQSPVAPGESRTSYLSSGSNIVRQNIDSSKATISTALPEISNSPSASDISGISDIRVRTRQAGIRTTTNGLITGNPIVSSTGIADDHGSSSEASSSRISRLSSSSTILRIPIDAKSRFHASQRNAENFADSRETTVETPEANHERASLSLSAEPSTASTTQTETSSKTTTSLGGASAASAANSITSLNNIQTARFTTSNLNGRKTSFASDRRRRGPERGPRLINGNPSGHDAT